MSANFIGFVTLTLGSGEPLYLNPDSVIAVTKATGALDNVDYSLRRPSLSNHQGTLIVTNGQGAFNHFLVQEDVAEVARMLEWKTVRGLRGLR